jgi:hypothetical protein
MPHSDAGDLTGARVKDIKYGVIQHIASRGNRNWWRRRWVVQEAAAATIEPVVFLTCGSLGRLSSVTASASTCALSLTISTENSPKKSAHFRRS